MVGRAYIIGAILANNLEHTMCRVEAGRYNFDPLALHSTEQDVAEQVPAVEPPPPRLSPYEIMSVTGDPSTQQLCWNGAAETPAVGANINCRAREAICAMLLVCDVVEEQSRTTAQVAL